MISLRFAPRATAGRPAIDLGQRVVVVVDSFFFCFVSFCFFLSLASKLRRARCDHGPAAAAEATPPPIRRPRQRPIGMRRWCPASELHLSSRDRRFYLFLFLKASSWYSSLLGFYWDLFRVFLVFQLGFLLGFFFLAWNLSFVREYNSFLWVFSLVDCGSKESSLGFTEFPGFKIGFTRFYKFFKGFFWDFTGSSRFCWVLLVFKMGFTGFHWVSWF